MDMRMRLIPVVLTIAAAALAAQESVIEVVSIKPSPAGTAGGSFGSRPGGGIVTVNMPMRSLISLAYTLQDSNRIEGAPEWFSREGFDVNAKYAGKPTPEQTQAAWREVFALRFKLKARLETREVPGFNLVLARPEQGVPKALTRISTDCAALQAARSRGESPPEQPLTPGGQPPCGGRFGGGGMSSSGMTMERLAQSIQGGTGRIWIDKTGLPGDYEFTLKYSSPRPGAPPDPDAAPDLVTALREQLGLKLEPIRTTTEYLVIEHIERPTPD
jgi:uncharacterized protein (TIGR03435 family)